MLWLIGQFVGSSRAESRKKLVLAACECARLTLPYVKKGEERPLRTIETTEAWANGQAKLKDVKATVRAADNAHPSVAIGAATNAAYAAYAINVAAAASSSAAAAGGYAAAYAGHAGGDAAAYAAAREMALQKSADIVRKHYPEVPKL